MKNTPKKDAFGANVPRRLKTNQAEQGVESILPTTSEALSNQDTTSSTTSGDNIYSREETLHKLITGIEKTCSLIEGAYGAAGGNVVVTEQLYPYHRVTNDGKTIVDKVQLADPVEQIGANFIKEAGDKAEKDSGDGRKTTMLLTKAIVQGIETVDIHPMQLKRQLDECSKLLTDAIVARSVPISIENVKEVATIACEDPEIGGLIQEIYQHIGKDGIIEYEPSIRPDTVYELHEGIRFRGAGYFGPYSCTEQGKAVYEKPYILVSKEKITSIEQLEPLYRILAGKNITSLVIFADEIDMSVAARLAYTHIQGQFKTHIIKQPTLFKDLVVDDFAKATGATVVSIAQGKTFSSLSLEDLGTCDKLITTEDETRLIGIKDISEHIEAIKEEKADNYLMRLAWLQTKAAVLKIGAYTESELAYKIKKAKDGISAAHFALKEGVVAGGGLTLLNIARILPDTVGGKILREALIAPFYQIAENAGVEDVSALEVGENIGYDAQNGSVCDLLEKNIVDPTVVVKNAVQNAISIAGTVLTISRAVVDKQV